MKDDRDEGPTFALQDVGFLDFETRSATDIKSGSVRYACDADAIVMAFAIGDDRPRSITVHDFDGIPLRWTDMPAAVLNHHERVIRGEAIWAAWNAGFDRAVWNYSTLGFPKLEPHHIIDVMAQTTANGLPPDLAASSRLIGPEKKEASGKHLIPMFCIPSHKTAQTPQTAPAQWKDFCDVYATADIAAMRAVFQGTRQLPMAEWREYWAMEAVNDRGVHIDLKLVAAAAKLALQDGMQSRDLLSKLTNGAVRSVDEVARIMRWLLARLPPEGRDILQKRAEETDEFGVVKRPAKHALTRRQVERLIAYLIGLDNPELRDVLAVAQIRLYGGSKTPAKFRKMQDSHVDGVLYSQYVFNGAGQTGRASSRGVQVHNLARDALAYEPDLLDAIIDRAGYDEVATLGDATPVARKLSLLIRPTFVPQGDNVFVWSDWSQIEARVLPWLCEHYAGAATRLQIFRAVDADPSVPDIYTRTAAQLSHIPIEQVTKPIRQRGKVAELALGFCGGVNALQAMAANYGLHLSDSEAKTIVRQWREANPWAMNFAQELWDAMHTAKSAPGHFVRAGRVGFIFLPGMLGGTLLCRLPSGRHLTYRKLRQEWVDVLDEDDNVVDRVLEWTYARSYGRQKLWPGIFVENVTQATAADFLRGTLVRLENAKLRTRLQTHDEIILEAKEHEARAVGLQLREIMQRGFEWSKGLPIMSEETIAYYYTKHEGSHGL